MMYEAPRPRNTWGSAEVVLWWGTPWGGTVRARGPCVLSRHETPLAYAQTAPRTSARVPCHLRRYVSIRTAPSRHPKPPRARSGARPGPPCADGPSPRLVAKERPGRPSRRVGHGARRGGPDQAPEREGTRCQGSRGCGTVGRRNVTGVATARRRAGRSGCLSEEGLVS